MTVRAGAVISGLNRHGFGVLLCHRLIDFGYVLVGEFLDFILGATFVVFGNFLFLDQLLECLVGFAPQVANRNFRVLALAPGNLGQVAPPFFRKRRHGYANIVAPGYGIEAKRSEENTYELKSLMRT